MFWTAIVFMCIGIPAMVVGFIIYMRNKDATGWDDGGDAKIAGNITKYVGLGLVALSLFLGLMSTLHSVPAGHARVLTFFGAVDQTPLLEGLNVVNPVKKGRDMSIKTEIYTGKATVLTKDGLNVSIELTVWHKVLSASAPRIYQTIGPNYSEKIIVPTTRGAIRDATVHYKATELYQKARTQLAADIEKNLVSAFVKRGIVCEKVVLRNVVLPGMVSEAISQKMKAQQEAQKMEYKLQKEEKEADRKRIEAQGIKDAQEIIDKTLTKPYLMYYYIETLKKLVDSPNNTVLILPADQNLTPMLNVPSSRKLSAPAK